MRNFASDWISRELNQKIQLEGWPRTKAKRITIVPQKSPMAPIFEKMDVDVSAHIFAPISQHADVIRGEIMFEIDYNFTPKYIRKTKATVVVEFNMTVGKSTNRITSVKEKSRNAKVG
jgi:hypothetical protein